MRYKIIVEYDGTNYSGWQKQNNKFTIQSSLEQAIKLLTKENVEVFGSGRTDAGVHALGQVAHFDLKKEFDPYKLMSAINFYLKSEFISKINCKYLLTNTQTQDISIIDCEKVDENFHARFSRQKRYYKYIILNRRQPTALLNNRVWQVYRELDFYKMQEATKFLIGKRDWSSFRDSECQAKSPIKTIDKAEIFKDCEEIIFKIEAKSFLHHMVRNIVGTLVDIGLGKTSIQQFQDIIEAKDRTKAGPTAPPQCLYFVKVDYIHNKYRYYHQQLYKK